VRDAEAVVEALDLVSGWGEALAPTTRYPMASAFHGAGCTMSTPGARAGAILQPNPWKHRHLVDGLADKDQLSGLQQTP
jgi:hypothetical protein